MSREVTQVLTSEQVGSYEDFPPEMTPLGLFVFLRTYSRYLTQQKRRETYKETCLRATRYNMSLVIRHLQEIGYQIDWDQIHQEALMLFDNMYHLKQFVSGRTLWIGGTPAAEHYSLSNFNCSALNITCWEDLCDLFYLLMVGTGVGFKSNFGLTQKMPKIRVGTKLIHSDYHPLPKHERLEHTQMVVLPNGFAKLYIGDSKEGWVEGLRYYLKILTHSEYEYLHTIKISYNSVRPRGERLKTFGGTSSGPEPLKEMFEGIDRVLKNTLDPWLKPMETTGCAPGYASIRPIHIMDIGNLIGQNVVVGGVRRCLPAGSLVHLKRGLVPIEQVKIGDEALTTKGYKVVTDWFDQGDRDLIKIITQDGDFTCTGNHRMPVMASLTSWSEYQFIEANQLRPGQKLISTRTPIEGVKTSLPTTTELLTLPDLDEDLAWFLGLYWSSGEDDGSMYFSRGPSEETIATQVIQQIRRFESDVIVTIRYESDIMRLIIQMSPQLTQYLTQHVFSTHVPDWILCAKHTIKLAYIAGLIDDHQSCVVRTFNERFAKDVQTVLYSCGLESSLWSNEIDVNYTVNLITRHSIRRVNQIPQLHRPISGEDLNYQEMTKVGCCSTSQVELDQYERTMGHELPLCPVEITGIEPAGKGHTYDITVDGPNETIGTHEFFVNGLLSHNTAEMFIFDPDDHEVLFAKYGLNGFYTPEECAHHQQLGMELEQMGFKPTWFDQLTEMFKKEGKAVRSGLNHRHMSNNSIMFPSRPDPRYLSLLLKILRYEGEPGLINQQEMKRRRPNAELINPCVTGDTLVLTDQGSKCVRDLIGHRFNVVNHGRIHGSTVEGFFFTGTRDVYRLTTVHGYSVRLTEDHQVLVQKKGKGYQEFVPANQLTSSDDVILNQTLTSIKSDPFESLTLAGHEDVYDCTIPGEHCFSANSIMVHNCGEVLLDTYQTCNLTTVNLTQFIDTSPTGEVFLREPELMEAQKLSVRAGIRMTLVTLELPHWDQKQKRDRLIGASLTGVKDAIDRLQYSTKQEYALVERLGQVARQEAVRYAKEIRIPAPLLVTTIKPEGSLSQLAGGVSQGLHLSHSPYFIRRVRINANDPMVSVIQKAHWPIHPENGTPGTTLEERMVNARTYVVDFPVASHARKTKTDVTIQDQLDTYFTYQRCYADHNCSNTISVKPGEWDQLPQIIHDRWDDYLGITFIPLDGGNYQLAPYEECTPEVYQHLKDQMKPLDMKLLQYHDRQLYVSSTDEVDTPNASIEIATDETMKSECAGGVCPLR